MSHLAAMPIGEGGSEVLALYETDGVGGGAKKPVALVVLLDGRCRVTAFSHGFSVRVEGER